jgi:hypothetical protein
MYGRRKMILRCSVVFPSLVSFQQNAPKYWGILFGIRAWRTVGIYGFAQLTRTSISAYVRPSSVRPARFFSCRMNFASGHQLAVRFWVSCFQLYNSLISESR